MMTQVSCLISGHRASFRVFRLASLRRFAPLECVCARFSPTRVPFARDLPSAVVLAACPFVPRSHSVRRIAPIAVPARRLFADRTLRNVSSPAAAAMQHDSALHDEEQLSSSSKMSAPSSDESLSSNESRASGSSAAASSPESPSPLAAEVSAAQKSGCDDVVGCLLHELVTARLLTPCMELMVRNRRRRRSRSETRETQSTNAAIREAHESIQSVVATGGVYKVEAQRNASVAHLFELAVCGAMGLVLA